MSAVDSIVAIANCSEFAARQLLDMCGGDPEQAIQLWFADEELQRNLTSSATVAAASERTSIPAPDVGVALSASAAERASLRERRNRDRRIGRQDSEGRIHLDSDDGDDDDDASVSDQDTDPHVEGQPYTSTDDTVSAAQVARDAQLEEDAAIARRMQEELYSSGGAVAGAGGGDSDLDADGVRAPLARTTETLVDAGFESFHDDYTTYGRSRAAMRARSSNPFSQSIWAPLPPNSNSNTDNPAADSPREINGESASHASRQNRLAELFRPPYDITSSWTISEARDEGKEQKKWILVNLQDMSIFQCQALNRDLWSDKALRSLIAQNFIFLQYEKSEPMGQNYIGFYMPSATQHENPANYPHVGIIDPRTGEQVKLWAGSPFPSAKEFHADLVEFLDRYSLDFNSKNPVSTGRAPGQQHRAVLDVDRMTEEEMLEMAMKNSLETGPEGSSGHHAGGSGPNVSRPTVHDPDSLTARPGGALAEDVPMTPAPESAAVDEEVTEERRLFATIASDRDHEEPTETNPATTTRIQFKHAKGRVIRRFRLDDSVRRIFEWLKTNSIDAEKQGVEFELKVQEGGNLANLIHKLDQTIGEANLKLATVMVEYLDDD